LGQLLGHAGGIFRRRQAAIPEKSEVASGRIFFVGSIQHAHAFRIIDADVDQVVLLRSFKAQLVQIRLLPFHGIPGSGIGQQSAVGHAPITADFHPLSATCRRRGRAEVPEAKELGLWVVKHGAVDGR
jgi:hypothetical protein